MKYILDAKGKRLGRIASEAARLLRGKGSPSFTPNELSGAEVEIQNASHLVIAPKKLEGTKYLRYTGYPGGLKAATLGERIEKKGIGEALRKTILGMLPRNRQRSRIIKGLTVKK